MTLLNLLEIEIGECMLTGKIFFAVLIVICTILMSRANSESPIACNMDALDKEQRQHHKLLTSQLQTAIQETRELKDGYSFRLPSDESMIQKTAEWITLERRCCPFIDFGLEVDREGGPLWLSLTGREGVKPFLKMELGVK